MILEELQEIFENITGQSDIRLSRKTKINGDIGLSSFTKIQLIGAVEDKYGIEIPDLTLIRFRTVGDIIDYLGKNGIK